MTRIGIGWVAAAALLSAALAPATQAATPEDTLVIAKHIDDIITLDPAEVFEFSGGEMITNVYDRIMTYEAEDTDKAGRRRRRELQPSATTARRSR